jgi:energy-coupling factor transporter ATP-binding protein EcfA2
MKIRDIRVQNLRNFGPDAPAVSFVDPDTNQVRPLTILVGANGSGKTTLLELIERINDILWTSHSGGDLFDSSENFSSSLKETTYVSLQLELNGQAIKVDGLTGHSLSLEGVTVNLFSESINCPENQVDQFQNRKNLILPLLSPHEAS